MACELVIASVERPKKYITNICHISGNLDHILIIYMNFVCILNIFTIYYGTYNIKCSQLNIKIICYDSNLLKQVCVLG